MINTKDLIEQTIPNIQTMKRNDYVRILEITDDNHPNAEGRVDKVFPNGDVWITNMNMPFQGSISGRMPAAAVEEIDVYRKRIKAERDEKFFKIGQMLGNPVFDFVRSYTFYNDKVVVRTFKMGKWALKLTKNISKNIPVKTIGMHKTIYGETDTYEIYLKKTVA